MELRKDPITQSWVIQDQGEHVWQQMNLCPLCPGQELFCPETIYSLPLGQANWQVRVVPHLWPLYQIEGDAQRVGDGIYDKMRNLGAHEIVIEHPDHHLPLSQQSVEHVAQILEAYVARSVDLKKDRRFRYVNVFRNQGTLAGQDLEHPHSEIIATPFIPRRVGYELRSAKRYYEMKERCLICDCVQQELKQQVRLVEADKEFVAFTPFASRVPYETWILPIQHQSMFEVDLLSSERQLQFARLLKSVLQRLEAVTSAYHLVLHTSPSLPLKLDRVGIWETLEEDYHWHFEILPIVPSKSKSYSLKEVYYNSLFPETAAEELRRVSLST